MENFGIGYSRHRGSGYISTRTFLHVAVLVSLLFSCAVIGLQLATPAKTVAAVTTVPTKMNFQGRLTDSAGNIKPNGSYNMKLKLYTVASAGSAVWSEDRLVSAAQGVTVTNGLFSLQLGDLSSLPASLFASGPLYLEVELASPATATSASPSWTEGPMSPRNQLATSAYAYNAETLDGLDSAAFGQTAGNNTWTGTNVFKNTGNSVSALAVQNAAGSSIFNVDTLTSRVGINVGSALAPLHVGIDPGGAYVNGFESGSVSDFTMSNTNGAVYWVASNTTANSGSFSASMPNLSSGGATSKMSLTRTLASSGTVSYYRNVATGPADFIFKIDGVTQETIDSTVGFTQASFAVAAGTHTFEWTVTKLCCTATYNAIYVDDIQITNLAGSNTSAIFNGSVGIGTTSPATALDVVGTIKATTLQGGGVDTASAGTLTVGGTNATNISLGANTTLAAGKSLTVSGGITSTRPVSPSEGMIYYDTSTKSLLTYSNGKWQADRSTATKIVAANNSSQAAKDAADYVANGNTVAAADGDQVEINAALTAASGGKVYLMEGTYTADATILIPNNTTLAGAGDGTIIELADLDATENLIENSVVGTGTGIVVQDLKLDGRKDLNTAGTQYGIFLNQVGDGTVPGDTSWPSVPGAKLTSLTMMNFRDSSIYLSISFNTVISNNMIQDNGGRGIQLLSNSCNNTVTGNIAVKNGLEGLFTQGSRWNTISGNSFSDNTQDGISITSGSDYNTITGNISKLNGIAGIESNSSKSNTFAGNTLTSNGSYGILLAGGSNNTVSANSVVDSGGAASNNGIYLQNSNSNSILGNNITDASATSDNYALNVFTSTSNTNLLSDNMLGGGTVNDLGTGTIYSGQLNASGNFVFSKASAKLGIGQTAPAYALDVKDTQASTYAARIENASTATTADGLLIDIGIAPASRTTDNYFIGFSGAGTVAGKIQGGASAVAYTTTAADYAEYFRADPADLPKPGELVALDLTRPSGVRRATSSDLVTGVISTNPGFVGNGPLCQVGDDDCDTNYAKDNVLVSLVGQVPLRVTGDIQIGDALGASSTPGVATKVTEGSIVGYALTASENGMVQVLIRPGTLSSTGGSSMQGGDATFTELVISGQAHVESLVVTGSAEFRGNLIARDATFTGVLTVNGHIVSGGATPTIVLADGTCVTATIEGTDTAGSITLQTKLGCQPMGKLLDLRFVNTFAKTPRVVLSPSNDAAAKSEYYKGSATKDLFELRVVSPLAADTSYSFDYIIIE